MSAASCGVMSGYSVLTTTTASTPPTACAPTKDGAEAGAMPANVSENIRPMVIAGLAKLVEEVKKYAAPIYAPTAAGMTRARPALASAKITRMRPSVAMISDRKWAPEARLFVEMVTAGNANIRFATIAPVMHPATWAG